MCLWTAGKIVGLWERCVVLTVLRTIKQLGIAVQFGNIIYLMKGAPQQVEATPYIESSFYSSDGVFFLPRRQTCCKLLWQPVAVILLPFHTLLDFLSLSAIAVFSVDDFQWERKNRPSYFLNSLHMLCPCHLIDRWMLPYFFALSHSTQSCLFIAKFLRSVFSTWTLMDCVCLCVCVCVRVSCGGGLRFFNWRHLMTCSEI